MMIKDITDTLPKHPKRKYGKRHLDKIQYIVLHHTGGKGTIPAFANYHVSKGWPGIGYHYVINEDGEIYQTNRVGTISYNVGGHNTKVVGIAVIGNYDEQVLNPCQKGAIEDLILLLKIILGNKPVKGHNEFSATACPGKSITEFIKTLN